VELRQLSYFVTVARERHFGRAAERLHIGQPAVSQQIRRLERELGVELLDRSPRHVRLTRAGELFLPEAEAVLAAAERARASVITEPPALRLGTSAGLGEHLERVLDRLAALVPGLAVELAYAPTAVRLEKVAKGELDAAFVRLGSDPVQARVRLVPVWRDPLLAALPARHELARSAEVSLPDLAGLPLRLTRRRRNPPLVDLVLSACAAAGFEPIPGAGADSLQDTLAAIGTGRPSWTVVFASHAAQLHSSRVAFVPFAAPGLSLVTALAVPPGKPGAHLDALLTACAHDHES
jgi:DNA-binding transcriptional LysR family regulator